VLGLWFPDGHSGALRVVLVLVRKLCRGVVDVDTDVLRWLACIRTSALSLVGGDVASVQGFRSTDGLLQVSGRAYEALRVL
jgi:hypothetical protein